MASRVTLLPAVAVLGLSLAACQEKVAAPAPKPDRPVLVERVSYQPLRPSRTFVATIRPRIESDLAFRVGGKVAQRLVNVGDRVKAGQTLATLDAADLGLQAEQAEAERGAAGAALANAEAELRRVSSLIEKGWSTAATLDRQRAAAEEARGRLARAERAVLLSRNALSYAALAATADGIVTATAIEPGQMVATDKMAVRVARLDEKEAVAAIPEALVGDVAGAEASVSLWSEPGRTYRATLRELSPAADPATRTYQARFALEGALPQVNLGQTATVTLSAGAEARVARLPLSALYNQGSGPALFVVAEDGSLALRPVAVAAYEAREVLVSSGVAEGERVVALGVQKLDPQQRVRVVSGLQF